MAKFVPQEELSLVDQARVRREKLAQLQSEGKDPFLRTRFVFDTKSAQIRDDFEALEGKNVAVAGRIMSKRGMGKVLFCDLQDDTGRIQLYLTEISPEGVSDGASHWESYNKHDNLGHGFPPLNI